MQEHKCGKGGGYGRERGCWELVEEYGYRWERDLCFIMIKFGIYRPLLCTSTVLHVFSILQLEKGVLGTGEKGSIG